MLYLVSRKLVKLRLRLEEWAIQHNNWLAVSYLALILKISLQFTMRRADRQTCITNLRRVVESRELSQTNHLLNVSLLLCILH